MTACILITTYITGIFLTALILGVLYKKSIIDWDPAGDSGDPPHLMIGLIWPAALAIAILYFVGLMIFRATNRLSSYIANIKFSMMK